ncbi:hypothetical protein NXS98_11100 [Fontisphaera persica]|uniref:lysophospholipid acyltransferase family protein n=1 Tax=Fontisphaera persica TaxID=2974023 RepID=UPI0024BF6054|nr:hypothetical protein [Fontisphaera persica]WCJ58272.1 hypothetical protein NXS98_11100 [Fontisphaera persica]
MDFCLYWLARAVVGLLQSLPLGWVARLGRAGGGLVYLLDARHRKMAQRNLAAAFPELPEDEIRRLAAENFRRIGENFACAVKTAAMPDEALAAHLEFGEVGELPAVLHQQPRSVVFAIGHFGNFELYARARRLLPGWQMATTYRALRQPRLNQLLQSLRERTGCLYFERRTEGELLRRKLQQERLILGLLSDQHGGRRGLRLPFFGRDAATNPAPAIFALRYRLPLFTGYCFRIGPARWRLEVGEQIPTVANGRPRPVEEIMRDVNRAFEQAIRRDPANWFWVHNRWKTPGRAPAPAKAMAKAVE